MKKITIFIMCMLFLTGCNNNTKETNINTVENTTIEETKEDNYDILTKDIEEEFDNKVKTTIENDIITSDIPDNHKEIKIIVTDKDFRDEIIDAEKNNNKELLIDIQNKVKNFTKKLDNEIDAISFGYTDKDGNINLVAYSQKNNDIIPILENENNNTSKKTNEIKNLNNNVEINEENLYYVGNELFMYDPITGNSVPVYIKNGDYVLSAEHSQRYPGSSDNTYNSTTQEINASGNYGDNSDDNYTGYFEGSDGTLIENPIYYNPNDPGE